MKRCVLFVTILLAMATLAAPVTVARAELPEGGIPPGLPAEVREAVQWLYSGNPDAEAYALRELMRMGEKASPAVPFLATRLDDGRPMEAERVPDAPGWDAPLYGHRDVRGNMLRWVGLRVAFTLSSMGTAGLDPLLAAVKSQNAKTRTGAAAALGRVDDPRVLEALVTCLSDRDGGVRAEAAISLGDLGDRRSVEPLVAALRDRQWAVRQASAIALGRIGDPRAVEPLIAALDDRASEVRQFAAEALGRLKDARAVGPLTAALQSKAGEIRANAIWALGQINDPRTLDPLLTTLHDGDALGRATAARVLAIRRVNATVTEALIIALRDPDPLVRMNAAASLSGTDDPRVVDALTPLLQDRYYSVRASAALALGQLGNPGVVEALVLFLTDVKAIEDAQTRDLMMRAISALAEAKAVDPLVELTHAPEGKFLWCVAVALAATQDPRAVEPLIAIMQCPVDPLRGTTFTWTLASGERARAQDELAASLLGATRDPRAVEPLISALRSRNHNLGAAAAGSLAEIGDRRAVEPLIQAVQVHYWYLQMGAARALRKLTGQDLTGCESDRWQQWWDQHKAEYEQGSATK